MHVHCGTSLVAQMVKNLLAMWETQVWFLDREEPLEKGMATHSSILTCEIPWTQEPYKHIYTYTDTQEVL